MIKLVYSLVELLETRGSREERRSPHLSAGTLARETSEKRKLKVFLSSGDPLNSKKLIP